jgi:D-lactate dehydrogenase
MKKIAFYDTKPYDKLWFDKLKGEYDFELKYFENKLNSDTAFMANKCDAVIAFVNDVADKATIDQLYEHNIHILAMRSAGYNNVDFKAAFGKLHIVTVPAYSPYAVAEHAMALLLTLNRKTHRAYNRTRDFNFSINGLTGFDLNGKTMGIIGTGKIGQVFANICKGFGMHILAFDPYPNKNLDVEYVALDQLCKKADIISLHCPLTKDTHHLINEKTIAFMKDGVCIINTSRGALIDSEALLNAIKTEKVGSAGLDVYEEESELFFEDFSNTILQDDILARLVSMPNVLVTSHQAFLTNEALHNIAKTTLENLKEYFEGEKMTNEICYQCQKPQKCDNKDRCF